MLGRGVLARIADRPTRAAVLAVLVALTVFAVAKNPIVNALYVARDRYLYDEAWAGDVPRPA